MEGRNVGERRIFGVALAADDSLPWQYTCSIDCGDEQVTVDSCATVVQLVACDLAAWIAQAVAALESDRRRRAEPGQPMASCTAIGLYWDLYTVVDDLVRAMSDVVERPASATSLCGPLASITACVPEVDGQIRVLYYLIHRARRCQRCVNLTAASFPLSYQDVEHRRLPEPEFINWDAFFDALTPHMGKIASAKIAECRICWLIMAQRMELPRYIRRLVMLYIPLDLQVNTDVLRFWCKKSRRRFYGRAQDGLYAPLRGHFQ